MWRLGNLSGGEGEEGGVGVGTNSTGSHRAEINHVAGSPLKNA